MDIGEDETVKAAAGEGRFVDAHHVTLGRVEGDRAERMAGEGVTFHHQLATSAHCDGRVSFHLTKTIHRLNR